MVSIPVIGLILRLLVGLLGAKLASMRVVNFASPLYVNFVIYFSFLIVAGFIGFLSGAYSLPAPYPQNDGQLGFSQFLNSAAIRPVFEYVIAAYYIGYFIILPHYLLKSERSLEYFFSVFKAVFQYHGFFSAG